MPQICLHQAKMIPYEFTEYLKTNLLKFIQFLCNNINLIPGHDINFDLLISEQNTY